MTEKRFVLNCCECKFQKECNDIMRGYCIRLLNWRVKEFLK